MHKYFLNFGGYPSIKPMDSMWATVGILSFRGYPISFYCKPCDADIYLETESPIDDETLEMIRGVQYVGYLGFGSVKDFIRADERETEQV